MNLHLTYFGDNNFSLGKKRIRQQEENFEVFKSIQEFDEHDLKNDSFWENTVQHMMQNRVSVPGKFYGYYAAKAYFVEKVLNKIPENDILLYVDSGCELNKNGFPKLEQYYQECLDTEGVFFSLDLPECQWTKMDTYCIIMEENVDYLMTRHIISTTFLLKNTSITRELVRKWKDICVEEGGRYLDDSPSELPNNYIFRENRHDQSILSLLVKKFAEEHDFTFH